MNESTFLSALLDDPTDEVTWFALADWLEEDGQSERAELIRLVRVLRSVPLMKRGKRRITLENRVTELLRAGVRPTMPEITNSIGMRLVLIPPGRFRMGSLAQEEERSPDEVLHEVEITRPFFLGVFSVTQMEFARLMGENQSHCNAKGRGRDRVAGLDTSTFPAEMVSWNDASEFCQRLSKLEGRAYRLPTEAEWEYACRGGSASTTTFYFGETLTTDLGNFEGPSPDGEIGTGLGRTCPVGRYPPNVFGVYDVHGNVFQWCNDWAGPYAPGLVRDPTGPAEGEYRTIRGGGWACKSKHCRAANRGQNDTSYRGYQNGLRVALSFPLKAR